MTGIPSISSYRRRWLAVGAKTFIRGRDGKLEQCSHALAATILHAIDKGRSRAEGCCVAVVAPGISEELQTAIDQLDL